MSRLTLSVEELKHLRGHLRDFDFAGVMNVLGWNRAGGPQRVQVGDETLTLKPIAQLGGVQVMEVTGGHDPTTLPLEAVRRRVSDEVLKIAREHVLIFVDQGRTRSHWYWVKRELDADGGRRTQPRTHTFVKGQPDDLFVSRLAGLFVDIAELNAEGDLSVTEAAQRLSSALDTEGVVRRFYDNFKAVREDFAGQIEGISDPRDRAWYASVTLNRLMFVYFLQGKGFLGRTPGRDGDRQYLQTHMTASKKRGPDRYYSEFLAALFFEAFALPEGQRTAATNDLVGQIPYLNGGLFLPHGIELNPAYSIRIPDRAFDVVLRLFGDFTWNLSDQDKHAGGLDPDVLGHIFEKYINQKGFGAYYTRPEITEYLCEQTVRKLVLDKIAARRPEARQHENLNDAIASADVGLVRSLLTAEDGLKALSLLDPACGSGAFLVAALKTLLEIYTALMGHIDRFNDPTLNDWRAALRGRHENASYNLKKKIITENLYGVDLMPEAAEIAKLRLFLALVSSAHTLDDLEPLPNIDFNILSGNSLVGLLEVDAAAYDAQRGRGKGADQPMLLGVGSVTYADIVRERQALLRSYRHASALGITDLTGVREQIQTQKQRAYAVLDELLHKQFHDLGIRYEEATWDEKAGKEGKPRKRPLTLKDITDLKPFHWAFEFAEVMERGGFDAVIANPPWDTVKPNGKEFLQSYSPTVSKNKMSIKDFEKERGKLLTDPAVRAEWLAYQSGFPHINAYFRRAPQFAHQISVVDGKTAGTDLNLYKLFLEQGYRLLRGGGECGIVIPSGVYTDLGAKGLREMLFEGTEVTGLFCFENRRMIFDNVDSRFKFVVLTFRKGGHTTSFPAAFMRHDVKDLEDFPGALGLNISVDTVRRLSPDSLSVMEFKSDLDATIAEKMLRFPLLGEQLEGVWNLNLRRELHMTDDSHLFRTEPGPGRLPLYEGKMIHQFRHDWGGPKYWLEESEARKELLAGRVKNIEREAKRQEVRVKLDTSAIRLDYESYRIAFRDVARNTDLRTFIATILQPNVFCPHTMSLEAVYTDIVENGSITYNIQALSSAERLFATALFNSFLLDSLIRQRVTAHVSFFFVYGLPVPRLTSSDPAFAPIVTAAARLICTTPEFDELSRAAGLRGHEDGVTDEAGRARLRAELDGLVAHLYGLTEPEFMHILGTFPLVAQEVKDAALQAFRDLAPPEGDPELVKLVAGGESATLEFKQTFSWDVRDNKAADYIKNAVFKTVVAFANAEGGTLLIGVTDEGRGVGLGPDFNLRPKAERSRDKFELYLRQQLRGAITPDVGTRIRISFPVLDGHEICRVDVQPANEPIHLGQDFYARVGNESRKLQGAELTRYVREGWPKP